MWTRADEEQVTLRQCIHCQQYVTCSIVERAIQYQTHVVPVKMIKPAEWVEGTHTTLAQCTQYQPKKDQHANTISTTNRLCNRGNPGK